MKKHESLPILAQQVPELDLILDGHSHTKYELRELAKSYILKLNATQNTLVI
ncbi:hypothetical protein [Mycoplasmopsis caviae]|uniref:Uncharacterized protein n=1 Tax=Mycoplasmopsis caviae TaxID=55603 RepID=A0A3P8MFF1_9BACT|nr:hypothetical protein [Mycoplasmopsis caviae]VDR42603.1 Uncharacterised protein [Mycoplasmopsis caviae]